MSGKWVGIVLLALFFSFSLGYPPVEGVQVKAYVASARISGPIDRGQLLWHEVETNQRIPVNDEPVGFEFYVVGEEIGKDTPLPFILDIVPTAGQQEGSENWLRVEPESTTIVSSGQIVRARIWVRVPREAEPGNYEFQVRGTVPVITGATGNAYLRSGVGIIVTFEVSEDIVWFRTTTFLAGLIGFITFTSLTLPILLIRRRKRKRALQKIGELTLRAGEVERGVGELISAQEKVQEALTGRLSVKENLSRLLTRVKIRRGEDD